MLRKMVLCIVLMVKSKTTKKVHTGCGSAQLDVVVYTIINASTLEVEVGRSH